MYEVLLYFQALVQVHVQQTPTKGKNGDKQKIMQNLPILPSISQVGEKLSSVEPPSFKRNPFVGTAQAQQVPPNLPNISHPEQNAGINAGTEVSRSLSAIMSNALSKLHQSNEQVTKPNPKLSFSLKSSENELPSTAAATTEITSNMLPKPVQATNSKSQVFTTSEPSVPEKLTLKVKSYRGKFGLLEMDSKRSAVFYIDQVWTKTSTSKDYCRFKEFYPENQLQEHYPVGTMLQCYAKKVSAVYHQALAVWAGGPIPTAFAQEEESAAELELLFNEFLFPTGLAFSYCLDKPRPTLHGHIQEYISEELGVIAVDNGGSALFHLDQFWIITR